MQTPYGVVDDTWVRRQVFVEERGDRGSSVVAVEYRSVHPLVQQHPEPTTIPAGTLLWRVEHVIEEPDEIYTIYGLLPAGFLRRTISIEESPSEMVVSVMYYLIADWANDDGATGEAGTLVKRDCHTFLKEAGVGSEVLGALFKE